MIQNKYFDQKVFAPHTVNRALLKTSRQSTDGFSLITFWTWRKEPKTSTSWSDRCGRRNRSVFHRTGPLL